MAFDETIGGEERPWGYFHILRDAPSCKVKEICVYPGHRLSYQYHHHRAEQWLIVSGGGVLTLNSEKKRVIAGEYIHIPKLASHRIENDGSEDLLFIEVQTGDYFGEEDIVRLSDDYDRTQ